MNSQRVQLAAQKEENIKKNFPWWQFSLYVETHPGLSFKIISNVSQNTLRSVQSPGITLVVIWSLIFLFLVSSFGNMFVFFLPEVNLVSPVKIGDTQAT